MSPGVDEAFGFQRLPEGDGDFFGHTVYALVQMLNGAAADDGGFDNVVEDRKLRGGVAESHSIFLTYLIYLLSLVAHFYGSREIVEVGFFGVGVGGDTAAVYASAGDGDVLLFGELLHLVEEGVVV